MSRKKRPQKVIQPAPHPLPVLHGSAFTAVLDEGRMLCNEVMARREFCADVVEYLKQKGLLDEWDQWRQAKRAPKPA
jgi:hypothetical protein